MSDLDNYRQEIDEIDEQILKLLAKRQAQIIKIAHIKQEQGMSARQSGRHQAVEDSRQSKAAEHGLDPAMVAEIWQAIMTESIRVQEAILSGDKY